MKQKPMTYISSQLHTPVDKQSYSFLTPKEREEAERYDEKRRKAHHGELPWQKKMFTDWGK